MPSPLSKNEFEPWQAGLFPGISKKLGAHQSQNSTRFAVWAPDARKVSVVGGFNDWDTAKDPMDKNEELGIWSVSIPEAQEGDFYKYAITAKDDSTFLKTDPVGFYFEKRPKNASVIYNLAGFNWQDDSWIDQRIEKHSYNQPLSIYEVHAGSWKRKDGNFLSYRELADQLIPYVVEMGFTHIELMPICEHPYDPSWGYQVTGFFAPTSRYGEPKEFMHFINECHKAGLGVIMDWVPGHFPKDDHGLHLFDGTPLYEYGDPLKREQKDWGTHIFDYGKAGVRNFLISSACFWLEKYHFDALRMDAIASMLYLNYSKKEGEWKPNKYGGKENLEAINFLKDLNEVIHKEFPGVLTFAEESSAWPGVTKPVENGGLGFDYKWNMGWMNDTLSYLEMPPQKREENPKKITFAMAYARDERFLLPLSHDEVVHLKKPLALKSPGSKPEKLANLRLLYTYMFGHPGKKLLFMGGEFGQTSEWAENKPLDWNLLNKQKHTGMRLMVKDLLKLYQHHAQLFSQENSDRNFKWVDVGDQKSGLFSFLRAARDNEPQLFFALNFSHQLIDSYKPKLLESGTAKVLFNSDSAYYGGSNSSALYGMDTIILAPFSGMIFSVHS